MSTSVELRGPQETWSPPAATPLDEAVWQAWVAKGRAQERRSSATRIKAVKWASIEGLLGAAELWSHLAPFEVLVRFLVTASALVLMFQAFQTRYYSVAAVFGALALLYNPVAPVFDFSGGWQRGVVVVSAVPFVASFVWGNSRMKAMTKLRRAMSISTLPSFLLLGVISAATLPGDLSKYRNYELGADLSTVAGRTGANPSQAKVIHNRPALIQQLEWRPQPATR